MKNIACVEVHNQLGKLLAYLRVNPDAVVLETASRETFEASGISVPRDLELTIQSASDIEKSKALFEVAYQQG